jgi:hypothetical protein
MKIKKKYDNTPYIRTYRKKNKTLSIVLERELCKRLEKKIIDQGLTISAWGRKKAEEELAK